VGDGSLGNGRNGDWETPVRRRPGRRVALFDEAVEVLAAAVLGWRLLDTLTDWTDTNHAVLVDLARVSNDHGFVALIMIVRLVDRWP
jgi:hypothetical protein